jgi:hypothetical protein
MIAVPRKMRSQALLVYSQSFIWQLPRVVTALLWPNEFAASPPFAGIRLATVEVPNGTSRTARSHLHAKSMCAVVIQQLLAAHMHRAWVAERTYSLPG